MRLFLILIYFLMLRPSHEFIDIGINDRTKINEYFLKTISHHYCDRLTGAHVILLAENSSASFYQVLQRSFYSTFYIHNTLMGNFSQSIYNILYIDDERFFLKNRDYDRWFWQTTKTYLIISTNRLQTQIIWSHIQRIWGTYKVFKISLLYKDDLKVLRIFDKGFYKYVRVPNLNYGVSNVKKYPLRVSIFPRVSSIIYHDGEWTGSDWNTLQVFSKKMNFAPKITWLSDQVGFGSLKNGVYTGLLAEVVYGRADVSFNSRFMNNPKIEKAYEYTKNIGLDYICFIAPRAEDLSRMQILLSTFTWEVWLCMAVTYALMIKSIQLFNEFNFQGGRKISNPSMTSLQVVLGMGVYDLPKRMSGRLLLVPCSAACFVIVSLFQASMVTKMSVGPGKHDIDTLRELDESGLEIRTSLQYVRDSLALYEYTKSLADKVDLEKDRRDFVSSKFVFTARITNGNLNKYSNYLSSYQNNSAELHIVRECPLKYYTSYAVALGFPFLNELNDVLMRLRESGIYDKWAMDTRTHLEEHYKPLSIHPTKNLRAYSINDLWFAFVLLLIGYTMSLVVLMFEFIFQKIKRVD